MQVYDSCLSRSHLYGSNQCLLQAPADRLLRAHALTVIQKPRSDLDGPGNTSLEIDKILDAEKMKT